MENPLETAGELAKDTGDIVSQGLFGLAGFLQQITGDATSAAIFAGFLIFTLGLLKTIAGSKNTAIYAKGLVAVGVVGILGTLTISAINAYGIATKQSILSQAADRIHYRAITNRKWGDFYMDEFSDAVMASTDRLKWYLMIFAIIFSLGIVLNYTVRKGPSKTGTELA